MRKDNMGKTKEEQIQHYQKYIADLKKKRDTIASGLFHDQYTYEHTPVSKPIEKLKYRRKLKENEQHLDEINRQIANLKEKLRAIT